MTSVAGRLWAWGMVVATSTVACGGPGGMDLFTPSTGTGNGPCIGPACALPDASPTTTLGAGGATSGGGSHASGGGGTDGTTSGPGRASSGGTGAAPHTTRRGTDAGGA